MDTHTIFIILICAALSFGVYGVVVQRGANLVRIDSRTALMALLWGAVELSAALFGYGIGRWILRFEMERDRSAFWVHLLAGVILAAIGIRMLMKAFRKKTFLEHRMENIDIRADVLLSLRLCVNGCFAGIACGLLRFNLLQVLAAAFLISAAFAVIGYITGRSWGAEPSGKAYAIGGSLLCALSIALQLVKLV